MLTALTLMMIASADPTDKQTELLLTFRSEFLEITPGQGKFPRTFQMGRQEGGADSERPVRQVTMRHSFSIAKYEVPQNLWEAVMGGNPSRWKGPRNSVEMLSFGEAVEFCTKTTQLMRAAKLIGADDVIRLPSEVEWEYVARAGTKTIYSFGDDVDNLDAHAWSTRNAKGNDPPVGALKPNPWGLYDVHGYLWEWCLDDAHPDYKGSPTDDRPWIGGGDSKRGVLRSGSWKDPADRVTSTARALPPRTLRDDAVGLRCVLSKANAATTGAFQPSAQDQFVSADSKLELLWNEGEFTEGPALAPDGTIVFSDIGDTMYRFNPETGKTSVFRKPSGRANGTMYNQRGELVVCEGANTGGGRRISITSTDGKVTTLADSYQGKRFNSPNDLAIDPQGRVYFTDPRYVGKEPRELDFEGVFLVARDGSVTLATSAVEKPNGILVSLDGKTVFVADNNPGGARHLLAFDVDAKTGVLRNKRVLFAFKEGRGIDGMTLDVEGNIYATAGSGDRSGIYIFSATGKQLAWIATPGPPTNCVFGGGKEANTLYITASGPPPAATGAGGNKYALYRIKLNKPGYHVVKQNSE